MSFLVVGTKKTLRYKWVSVLSRCPKSGFFLVVSGRNHISRARGADFQVGGANANAQA